MGKMKEHYYVQLEALSECSCSADIRAMDDLCSPCESQLPDEVINRMANELNDTQSEKEFWSKMNEIEEYYEEHYMSPHVTEAEEETEEIYQVAA